MYVVPRPSRFQIKTDEMWEVILLSFRLTVALAVTELIQLHLMIHNKNIRTVR